MKNKNLILNPYFLVGLFLLIINDLYLKYEYGNFITGKLSDFAGLLIFPIFMAYLIPGSKKLISLLTGIAFILWKTPLATPFIDSINQTFQISIYRTIDYTDYIALFILPFSHYLINFYEYKPNSLKLYKLKSTLTYPVLAIAFCAFCSTSVPRPLEIPQGTVYIGKSYNIKLPKDSVINAIIGLGYNCELYNQEDTINEHNRSYSFTGIGSYYQTDNIVRYSSIDNKDAVVFDTIANIKYKLIELDPNKTRLTIINVTIFENGAFQDWKQLKSASRQYESWLKENLIEKID